MSSDKAGENLAHRKTKGDQRPQECRPFAGPSKIGESPRPSCERKTEPPFGLAILKWVGDSVVKRGKSGQAGAFQ